MVSLDLIPFIICNFALSMLAIGSLTETELEPNRNRIEKLPGKLPEKLPENVDVTGNVIDTSQKTSQKVIDLSSWLGQK